MSDSVRLCATPKTAAHQAQLSLGFSRQEHWSGLPFPSPMNESEKWKWSHSVVSDSVRPHGLQPTRLLHPWDFPGKSAGVGCHCLLQNCHYYKARSKFQTWSTLLRSGRDFYSTGQNDAHSKQEVVTEETSTQLSRSILSMKSLRGQLLGNHWPKPPALARHNNYPLAINTDLILENKKKSKVLKETSSTR